MKRDGIYFFKDVMAARVQVADKSLKSVDQFLWHQRLVHPSFSVLSFLPMFLNKYATQSSCDIF